MSQFPQQRKDPVTLALCAVLLLGTALVFSAVGDAPHTLGFAAAGLGLSFVFRRPLARTSRTYVYSGVAVITLVVVQHQFFSIEANRFVLLPTELYCPALIFLGVALTFFDQREATVGAIIGASLLGMMVAGNTFGAATANSRFVAANFALSNLHLFYTAVVIVQLGALLPLLARSLHRQHQEYLPARYRIRRTAVVGSALLLVLVGGEGLRRFTFANADRVQFLFQRFLQQYAFNRMGYALFPQVTDLWRTVSPEIAADRTVVLYARTARAPGYLRGRAYHRYENGQWSTPQSNNPTALAASLTDGHLAVTRYYYPGSNPRPESSETIDILAVGAAMGDVLLAPGNMSAVTIVAEDVESDPEGTLFARKWERGGGYGLEVDAHAFAAAYQGPLEESALDGRYTALSPGLRDRLEPLAAEIFAGFEGAGTAETIDWLAAYLSRNHSYALGRRMRPGMDPVLQFLTEHRSGHCELFAAAAALLLRTQGIPTRYVTGFVCTEQHPLGGHWIARMRDAHAWVEVYIPEEQRWRLLEATPASGVPGGRNDMNWFTAWIDHGRLMWNALLANVKRGYLADAVFSVALLGARAVWRTFAHPLRGTLAALAAVIGSGVLVALRTRRRPRSAVDSLPTIRRLRRGLHDVEKYAAKHGVRRAAHHTVREFAQQIRTAPDMPRRQSLLEILKEYETLRYAGSPPSAEVSRSFRQRVRRALRNSSKRCSVMVL